MSEPFETLVTVAAGLGLLRDVDILNRAENGHSIQMGSINVIPCFFLLVDVLDVALDIVFSVELFKLGERSSGALMVSMTIISLLIWIWTRAMIWHAVKNQYGGKTVRSIVLFAEISMFLLQDACTITLFYSVPESYGMSAFSSANLIITLICGAGMMMLSLFHQADVIGCEVRCCTWGCIKVVTSQFLNVVYSLIALFAFLYYAVVSATVIENKVGGAEDSMSESLGGHEEAAGSVRAVYYGLSCSIWGVIVLINIFYVHAMDCSEASLKSLGFYIFIVSCCGK